MRLLKTFLFLVTLSLLCSITYGQDAMPYTKIGSPTLMAVEIGGWGANTVMVIPLDTSHVYMNTPMAGRIAIKGSSFYFFDSLGCNCWKASGDGGGTDSLIFVTITRLKDSLSEYVQKGDSGLYVTISRLTDSTVALRLLIDDKLDTIYKSNDTVYQVKNGVRYFAFIDNSGGTASTLTFGNGLVSGTFNGSTPVTIEVDSAVMTTLLHLNDTLNQYLLKGDTAAMLDPYLRKIDTTGTTKDWTSEITGKPTILSGSGTANYIPKWTGGTSLGTSGLFFDDVSTPNRLGLGTASPAYSFDISQTSNPAIGNGVIIHTKDNYTAGTNLSGIVSESRNVVFDFLTYSDNGGADPDFAALRVSGHGRPFKIFMDSTNGVLQNAMRMSPNALNIGFGSYADDVGVAIGSRAAAVNGGTAIGFEAYTGTYEGTATGFRAHALGFATQAYGSRCRAEPRGPSGDESLFGSDMVATGNVNHGFGGGFRMDSNFVVCLGCQGNSEYYNFENAPHQGFLFAYTHDDNVTMADGFINYVWFGPRITNYPHDLHISTSSGNGTDASGQNMIFDMSQPTGNSTVGGNFIIRTPITGTSGTALQSLAEAFRITPNDSIFGHVRSVSGTSDSALVQLSTGEWVMKAMSVNKNYVDTGFLAKHNSVDVAITDDVSSTNWLGLYIDGANPVAWFGDDAGNGGEIRWRKNSSFDIYGTHNVSIGTLSNVSLISLLDNANWRGLSVDAAIIGGVKSYYSTLGHDPQLKLEVDTIFIDTILYDASPDYIIGYKDSHLVKTDVTGGGSGTVSSFSAGTLSPLFTTSVATATTTPTLSFSLSNAGAHKFFGNNTGSTAAPNYVSITSGDLPDLSATYVATNGAITGATKTKITYDSKGLVTAGTDATTTDIAEGTNLYWTNSRFDTRFGTKTTDDLTEGSTNKYYTDARARAAISTADHDLSYSGGIINTNKTPLTLTDAATVTWNRDNGFNAAVTITADRTLSITNPVNGDYGTLIVYQDGTAGHTLTLPNGSATLNSGANDSTILSWYYSNDAFHWALNSSGGAGGGGTWGSITGTLSAQTDLQSALDAKVPTTRTISTTSPLSGGGDLSANRTIAIADASADGTTKGAASFTANDFNTSSGNVSIDYTNGQAASTSNKGFLTNTDWNTFNGKAASGANTDITSVLLNQTGLVVKGASANGLTIKPNETLSAGRTLNIKVNDADKTVDLGGNVTTASSFTTSGANALTLTTTSATNVTLPTTGTLSTLAGTETFTNKRITKRTGTTTSSATPTINPNNVDIYTITAQAVDITSMTTNLTTSGLNLGDEIEIWITGTATRAITWGASFAASQIAIPTSTSGTSTLHTHWKWDGSVFVISNVY